MSVSATTGRTSSRARRVTEDDYGDFNAGVMVMNVKGLRDDLDEFTAFIRGNLSNLQAYDQGAYRMFYEGRVDPSTPSTTGSLTGGPRGTRASFTSTA